VVCEKADRLIISARADSNRDFIAVRIKVENQTYAFSPPIGAVMSKKRPRINDPGPYQPLTCNQGAVEDSL
jgi:hypothetical protein